MKPTQEQMLYQRALRDKAYQVSILHAAGDKLPTAPRSYAERTLYACTYYGYLVGKYGPSWVRALLQGYQLGDRVRYVPNHAGGDLTHKDCQNGVVKSMTNDGEAAFVIYDNLHGRMTTGSEPFTAARTRLVDLVPLLSKDEDPAVKDFDPATL